MNCTLVKPSAAQIDAAANLSQNLAALRQSQRALADRLKKSETRIGGEFVYARDGTLTRLDEDGRWWSGCSVPALAARNFLAKLEIRAHACFLSPSHPAQLQYVLRHRLRQNQALLAVIPDPFELTTFLHLEDFTESIDAHRIWFATGDAWTEELSSILKEHPGLPIPQQFIRTPMPNEEQSQQLIDPTTAVFTELAQQRSRRLRELVSAPPPGSGTLGTIVPSRFRLWEDAPARLSSMLECSGCQLQSLNTDDPCHTGPLAFAELASRCDALVVANCTRHELSGMISQDRPIITWVTVPRIPPFSRCHENDGLILAEQRWLQPARQLGWPEARLAVGAHPPPPPLPPPESPAHIAIIADTVAVSKEACEFDLSSHRLLWEMIEHELSQDPLNLGTDADEYLSRSARHLNIDEKTLDRKLFLQRLIQPAYQQGVARTLIHAGVPVKLYGNGWETFPQFAGAIGSSSDTDSAIRAAAAIVNVWPLDCAHPVRAAGRPVITPAGQSTAHLTARARDALRGALPLPSIEKPLTWETISALLPAL